MFIPFTLAFIELLATEANAKDLDLFDLDVEQRRGRVDVSLDQPPFTASSSRLSAAKPPRFLQLARLAKATAPRKPPDGRLINLLRLIPKIVCDKRDES